ncbi:MAG: transcriptional regulator/antitoxin, MazE [Candidatus Poribacteria bacterium]|nr:transcriptional regulator/antitoxin, MazE [Candidatus Poribacteria bacterium]
MIKIKKTENQNCIYLTKAILDAAGINVGEDVEVTIQNGRIIVETATQARRRTDLQTLLDMMPDNYEPEEINWGKPTGKEVW